MEYLSTLLDAFFATILGIALIIQPEKTRPALVDFMGIFWFAGGLLSLRRRAKNRRWRWLGLIFGIFGVITGTAVLARYFIVPYIAEVVIVNTLAALMILTGMIHVAGGPVGEDEDDIHSRRRSAPILGLIEIVLGILVFLAQDLSFSPIVYYLSTLWAFVGGMILFGDALRQHRRAALHKEKLVKGKNDVNR